MRLTKNMSATNMRKRTWNFAGPFGKSPWERETGELRNLRKNVGFKKGITHDRGLSCLLLWNCNSADYLQVTLVIWLHYQMFSVSNNLWHSPPRIWGNTERLLLQWIHSTAWSRRGKEGKTCSWKSQHSCSPWKKTNSGVRTELMHKLLQTGKHSLS